MENSLVNESPKTNIKNLANDGVPSIDRSIVAGSEVVNADANSNKETSGKQRRKRGGGEVEITEEQEKKLRLSAASSSNRSTRSKDSDASSFDEKATPRGLIKGVTKAKSSDLSSASSSSASGMYSLGDSEQFNVKREMKRYLRIAKAPPAAVDDKTAQREDDGASPFQSPFAAGASPLHDDRRKSSLSSRKSLSSTSKQGKLDPREFEGEEEAMEDDGGWAIMPPPPQKRINKQKPIYFGEPGEGSPSVKNMQKIKDRKALRSFLEALPKPNKTTDEAESIAVESMSNYLRQSARDYFRLAKIEGESTNKITRAGVVDLLREQGLLPVSQTLGDAVRRLFTNRTQMNEALGVSQMLKPKSNI